MAKLILRDAYLVVNAVNLSAFVESVTINSSREDVEATSMGAQGVQRLPGLRDESIEVTFRQDYAAAQVDATLWPLYDGGTLFAVEVRPTSAAVGAGNPKWTGNCYLNEYTPVDGSVGDVANAEATLLVDGVLTRATA